MTRRRFLQGAAQTAILASTALSAQRVAGANERVNVGLIGCGGRGRLLARLVGEVPNARVTAICDVHRPQIDSAAEAAAAGHRSFTDFRRVLDLNDIVAIIIATPDHWHAIPTILGCQAGKDVYVEKPLGHTIREGRAMLDAARRHNRVVQVGIQHRSAEHYRQAAEIMKSGQLGPVHLVRIWNYINMSPEGIGRAADSDPPPGLDWDLYLGPAPLVPFNRNRFISTYRWFWDYGGGMVTDFGTHRFDSMHQVMGADAPLSVTAAGGRYVLKDGGETPDVVQVTYEYPTFILTYEACTLNSHGAGGRTPGKAYYQARGQDDRPHGEAFYGANGTLMSDRIGFEVYPEPRAARGAGAARAPAEGSRTERREASAEDATPQHIRNFIDCIRSREKPAADIEVGHRASIVAHLGNIAFRTGRKIRWDAAGERIIDDAKASRLLHRPGRIPWNLV